MLLSFILCGYFLSFGNSGIPLAEVEIGNLKKERITKYGQCTATRTATGGGGFDVVITCGKGSMLCYTQDGGSIQTGPCNLEGDWGPYVDGASFTFNTFQVLQEVPIHKVKYTGTVLD